MEPINNNIPEIYGLYQNCPNPFNPVTKIKFDLPRESYVRIIIYDINGQEISVPINQNLKAASYEFTFNVSLLSSGIYFYRLETSEFTETLKMIVVK